MDLTSITSNGTSADVTEQLSGDPQRLFWTFTHFRRWSTAVFPDVCGEYLISQQQVNVLYIVRTRGASMAEISRQLFVAPTVITGLVDRLERCGFLRREPDPDDRRKIKLCLTDRGFRASVEIEKRFSELLKEHIDQLSPADQDHLTQGLDVLMRVIAGLESAID